MGIYTTYNSKIIDQQLDKYFNKIINSINKIVGVENIKAIVLFGSFGKGEGGVILKNEKVIPVNDFDITIFIKGNLTKLRKLHSKKLEESAQILSKEIGIKQIDLDLSHPLTLLFSKKNNACYERYNGYKLLWGNIDIRKRMLKPNVKKIKIIDGTNYFLTRGSGLVLAGYCLREFNKNVPKVILENFEIELNKALLAIGDSYLIKNKKYHFSYEQRKTHAKQLNFCDIDNGAEIKELYLNALDWKLKPSFKYEKNNTQIKKFKHILNIFSTYFLWFESKRLNTNFSEWIDYSKRIIHLQETDTNLLFRKSILDFLNNPKDFMKNIINSGNYSNSFSIKLSIMSLILFSFYDSEKTIVMMEKANNDLQFFYKAKNQNDWTSLAEEYLKVFHSNGLLNYILNELKEQNHLTTN